MKNYERATITIPRDLYQRVRTSAAREQKSVSGFITDILQRMRVSGPAQKKQLPFGKYALRKRISLHRAYLYANHLRRKVSS